MTISEHIGAQECMDEELRLLLGSYTPFCSSAGNTWTLPYSRMNVHAPVLKTGYTPESDLKPIRRILEHPTMSGLIAPWCMNDQSPYIVYRVVKSLPTLLDNLSVIVESDLDPSIRAITFYHIKGPEKTQMMRALKSEEMRNKPLERLLRLQDSNAVVLTKGNLVLVGYTQFSTRMLLATFAMSEKLMPCCATNERPYDTDIFKMLLTDDYDKWLEQLKAYVNAASNAYRAERIDANYKSVAEMMTIGNLKRLLEQVKRLDDEISNREQSLQMAYKEQNNAMRLAYSYEQEQQNPTQMIKLLKERKEITEVSVVGNSTIMLTLSCPCISYDAHELEIILKRTARIAKPAMQVVLREIFLEEKYTLLLKAQVYYDMQRCEVKANKTPDNVLYKTPGLLNPHLTNFNCFGTNKSLIEHGLIQGQPEVALNCTMAACSNLNFLDGTVMNRFAENLETKSEWQTPCLLKENDEKIYTLREVFPLEYAIRYVQGGRE